MSVSAREKLKKMIAVLPATAGVYLMKDVAGKVIYIGKARDLRRRVRSYFTKRQAVPKITVLKEKVALVEYVETPTEVEALLLEAHLINKHNPRYNTLLTDDKSYPLLKISGEEYPRIMITRERSERRAKYYGPYTDAKLLREAVYLINNIFPIRKCIRLPKSACLYYYLHQCLAPCISGDVKEEYAYYIKEIESFLRGSKKSLIEYLTGRMKEAATKLRFEEADMFKRQIQALEKLKRRAYSIVDPGASIALSGSVELKKVLDLRKVPAKIACFDVSNIHGRWAVASRVTFFREMPDKQNYRRYKIKSVQQIDDYAMIREALGRMCRGIKEGRERFKPDLIVIDGGKGHLGVGVAALGEEGLDYIPCIALAKKFETVFSMRTAQPVPLIQGGPAHNLLRRIRDEAHRFAITYHRNLREKEMSLSQLDAVKGIGTTRKERLLHHFNSIDDIARASVDEIAKLQGFTPQIAKRLLGELTEWRRDRTEI